MWTGVQWAGTIAPNSTDRWFTWGWPTAWHVMWYVMPTSPQPGAPELGWEVATKFAALVERLTKYALAEHSQ